MTEINHAADALEALAAAPVRAGMPDVGALLAADAALRAVTRGTYGGVMLAQRILALLREGLSPACLVVVCPALAAELRRWR